MVMFLNRRRAASAEAAAPTIKATKNAEIEALKIKYPVAYDRQVAEISPELRDEYLGALLLIEEGEARKTAALIKLREAMGSAKTAVCEGRAVCHRLQFWKGTFTVPGHSEDFLRAAAALRKARAGAVR